MPGRALARIFLLLLAICILDTTNGSADGQKILTLPDGVTLAEALHALNTHPGLTGDPLSAKNVELAEGILLPGTYPIPEDSSRRQLFDHIRRTMEETIDRLWQTRPSGLPFNTPGEAIVLASLVEKEFAGPKTVPGLIAGVYVNRLEKGMKLQSDPSLIHAITLGLRPLGRPLIKSDLAIRSPYNTYYVEGLPPGPICNPGLRSLKAVFNPTDTDYLYFIPDGNGGHAYARTSKEHRDNIRKWRETERRQPKLPDQPTQRPR